VKVPWATRQNFARGYPFATGRSTPLTCRLTNERRPSEGMPRYRPNRRRPWFESCGPEGGIGLQSLLTLNNGSYAESFDRKQRLDVRAARGG
jgi:hypothetical protein